MSNNPLYESLVRTRNHLDSHPFSGMQTYTTAVDSTAQSMTATEVRASTFGVSRDAEALVAELDGLKITEWLDRLDKGVDAVAAGHLRDGDEFKAALRSLSKDVAAMIASYNRRLNRPAGQGVANGH